MKTRPTCVFTVVSATNIAASISWFDRPRAMSVNTSRSRSVSCSTAASAAAFAEDGPAPASVRLATMRSIQWQGRLPRSHRWCRRCRRCRRSCREGSRSGHGHRWTATAVTRIAAPPGNVSSAGSCRPTRALDEPTRTGTVSRRLGCSRVARRRCGLHARPPYIMRPHALPHARLVGGDHRCRFVTSLAPGAVSPMIGQSVDRAAAGVLDRGAGRWR